MLVVRTIEGSTHSSGQLVSCEQSIGLYNLALAMNPLGLHRIEPRALYGQQTSDDPHPFLLALFQSPIVRSDPPSDLPAYVPACVVPDQHPHSLAQSLKLLAAPRKKARGYTAHRSTVHKPKPTMFELGHVQPVARDGLRVGIIFFDRLLYKTQRLASFAKAVQIRLPHSAPPALLLKADHPIELILGQVHQSVASEASLFSFVQGIRRGNPVLGPLPANPHARQGGSDGLPRYPLLCESLLKAHLRCHGKRPQAAWLAELPGAPVKHLAQSLGPLLIEGPMNGVRAVRTPSQRLLETLLVEDVDGVAHGLRVTAEVASDLVGVLSIGAFEQDLAAAQSEGIRRAQSRLQGLALGVTQRTHEDWWFHSVQDNH